MSDKSLAEIKERLIKKWNTNRPIPCDLNHGYLLPVEYNRRLLKIGLGVVSFDFEEYDSLTDQRLREEKEISLGEQLDKCAAQVEFRVIPPQIDLFDAVGAGVAICDVTEQGITFFLMGLFASSPECGRVISVYDAPDKKQYDTFTVFTPFSNIRSISSFQGNFMIKECLLDS